MSNIKSEQLSFYQLFATKGYKIEIPIIQRDYAQGRKSTLEVRNDFLTALYNYLEEGKPLRDLDFVYGDVQDGKLIPLDGQQRLTTLFLLHWYLAHLDGEYQNFQELLFQGEQSRFTYKTRQSSNDFCNALLKNGIDLDQLEAPDKDKKNSLSKTIRDKNWYFLSWQKDPTVLSMLRMLDAIHDKFKKNPQFYNLLINLEKPIITFQFLPLQDYGLTDDLYIKMNSRGKMLTKFENLKAKFEQHIKNSNYKNSELKLDFGNGLETVEPSTYFSHKIDTQWAHLFWSLRKKDVYVYDNQFWNFFASVAINNYALEKGGIKNEINNQENLSIKFFTERNEDFTHTIITLLDLISGKNSYTTYLQNENYYQEIRIFKALTNKESKTAEYEERLLFFAYYSFLIKWNGLQKGFDDWMRVMRNLIRNTGPYDGPKEFVNSLSTIQKMLNISDDVVKHLKLKPDNIRGFNPTQVKEEIIKAFLLTKNEKWVTSIYEHERQEYFQGQLTFALAFSGVEEYFNQNGNCNWDDDQDELYFKAFEEYIEKGFSLFESTNLKEEAQQDYLLHRAILSKGDYLLSFKSNYSFLKDSDRDISWKRLFLGDGNRKVKREFLKELLDDPRFDTKDLYSLKLFQEDLPKDLPAWRRKFIERPKLFDYMQADKYIRYRGEDDIRLLKGIKVSGEQWELFSLDLFHNLEEKLSPTPFEDIKYLSLAGKESNPFFCFRNWKIDDKEYQLNIIYEGKGKYRLKFFEKGDSFVLTAIKVVLDQYSYSAKENKSFQLYLPEDKIKDHLEQLLISLNKEEWVKLAN